MAELDGCVRAPHWSSAFDKFDRVLRSVHAPCMRCGGHLSEHGDERYWCGSGVRLDIRLDNKQAAAIAREQRSGGQVSAVYQRLRERCQASLRAPPTKSSKSTNSA